MEIRQMSYARAIQWRHAVLAIISDFVGGTWDLDRCVVILRGLPGSGKSMFADLLAREFREEFHFGSNPNGTQRVVRTCTKAFYQVCQGREDASAEEFVEQDVKSSLEAAHVVIVDDAHVAKAEWELIVNIADEYWREEGIHGKIYMVNIAWRDEELAAKLNSRTWRPLPDEGIQQLYEVFAALEAEVTNLPNCYTVDPEI